MQAVVQRKAAGGYKQKDISPRAALAVDTASEQFGERAPLEIPFLVSGEYLASDTCFCDVCFIQRVSTVNGGDTVYQVFCIIVNHRLLL
jgi:hypothetical protein